MEGKKTDIIKLFNKDNDTILGEIKWYGPFRKYAYFPPENPIVLDNKCLETIKNYLEEINIEHRKNLKRSKENDKIN